MLEHYTNTGGQEIQSFLDQLIASTDLVEVRDLLETWEMRGPTEGELFELTRLMRSRMKRIDSGARVVTDIVGTGGSRNKTFNVSTAAAFVLAGSGLKVAKHGNRAATSTTGSADVLNSLGILADADPQIVQKCLDEAGICFMFAPRFHKLSPTLAAVRRDFGKPTIFNNLGPLCNPASAGHQLIGVWTEKWLDRTAKVLARLGTTRSWVVNGENGLDEIALCGKTDVVEVAGAEIRRFKLSVADFGIKKDVFEVPQAESSSESADIINRVLKNDLKGEGAEAIVLVNAAAAIYISNAARDLSEAYMIAETSLREGKAYEKLVLIRQLTNE
jgi:anthranilate phosphoribosyltransferase